MVNLLFKQEVASSAPARHNAGLNAMLEAVNRTVVDTPCMGWTTPAASPKKTMSQVDGSVFPSSGSGLTLRRNKVVVDQCYQRPLSDAYATPDLHNL